MRLVLGYGNTLRGDDGFGPAVALYLRDKLYDGPLLEIISAQQLLPEHAENAARSSLVVFVDASRTTEAGQIVCTQLLREKEVQEKQAILAHALSPSTILKLATSLYGHSPEAYLYTVGPVSLELGETLSPLVKKAIPKVAKMILDKLAQFDHRQTV